MRFTARKLAVLLASSAAGLGLVGYGVHAAFTSSGQATASIAVGSMDIALQNATNGATVVDSHHVTFAAPGVTSSTAGSSTFSFDIKNVGSMPANVTVTASAGGDPSFSDNLALPSGGAQYTIQPGAVQTISNAGLKWGALSNSDLNSSATVTYAISATA
jgi:hypothetical protein